MAGAEAAPIAEGEAAPTAATARAHVASPQVAARGGAQGAMSVRVVQQTGRSEKDRHEQSSHVQSRGKVRLACASRT